MPLGKKYNWCNICHHHNVSYLGRLKINQDKPFKCSYCNNVFTTLEVKGKEYVKRQKQKNWGTSKAKGKKITRKK